MVNRSRRSDSRSIREGAGPRAGRVGLAGGAAALAAAALLAGCGGTTGGSGTGGTMASAVVKTAQVTVNGTKETVLTNSSGRTLYYFTKDGSGKSNCTGSCSSLWPALTTTRTTLTAPAGVSGRLKTFSDSHGTQVEYNGHPLYTYSGDSGPDQSHGEGVLGEWYVATPKLAAAPGASPSSSGGGYSY